MYSNSSAEKSICTGKNVENTTEQKGGGGVTMYVIIIG